MRKTLTAILVVAAAGSLAACKMPWDREKHPTPVPVASPDTPTPATTAGADPAKSATPELTPASKPATK